jgi:hypothetical protein
MQIFDYQPASDKVYQLLSHDRWFSPASSTTKTGRHDIAEILIKHQKSINQSNLLSTLSIDGNTVQYLKI